MTIHEMEETHDKIQIILREHNVSHELRMAISKIFNIKPKEKK